jgi:nicotinamide riboside transporter PnuC
MLKQIKLFYRENKVLSIILPITFILVLTTGIIFKQDLLSVLPLFVSLIVMVLQARVNRYGLLLGSLNSLLYCYYYFTMGLMSNFLYAIIISFPMQMISFINWSRNTKGKITKLKKMSAVQYVFSTVAVLISWGAIFFGISLFGNSSYSFLDTLTTVLGITVTVLTMLRFSEYVILQCVSCTITIIMYITIIIGGDLASITYLVYAVYCLICVIMAAVRMFKTHPEIIANRKKKSIQEECL